MAGASSASTSLKEYLKKYTSNDDEKRKKKKRKKAKPDASGVLVVDEDPVWQMPVKLVEEEDSADEEKPQVDEDIEVKRMRRLEQLRSKRPFGAISEDGSGWISVSNNRSCAKYEDQSSDLSPPRKSRNRNDTPSPEPHQGPGIPDDADLSPPRRSEKHHRRVLNAGTRTSRFPDARVARLDTPSPELHQEASGHGRVTDLSPPRRQRRDERSPHPKVVNSDISPPRRGRHESRYQIDPHAPSEADLSPPRKARNDRTRYSLSDRAASVSDLSPPRKRQKELQAWVHPPKTGLVSGGDIKDEIDRKKLEDWSRFKEMDPSISGRGAEAVYRNKITGERMSKEEFLNSHNKEKRKDEKPKEIKLEWGKGLAQKREAENRLKELEAEKDKPFARNRDDPDLDAMLKERVRWGDPMAHLVKKKHLEPVLPDLGDNEKMKESGFVIPQEIPSHSWIRRGVDAPPNRYGIKPGRPWDGVDRSNGYEREMFKRMNEKSATEREAYLWSVSDM